MRCRMPTVSDHTASVALNSDDVETPATSANGNHVHSAGRACAYPASVMTPWSPRVLRRIGGTAYIAKSKNSRAISVRPTLLFGRIVQGSHDAASNPRTSAALLAGL